MQRNRNIKKFQKKANHKDDSDLNSDYDEKNSKEDEQQYEEYVN